VAWTGLPYYATTISGLSDGVSYVFGVRAYNTVAEEVNTSTASMTADSTAPGVVDGLTGTATASD
jgi:hypothetical protein